MTRKLPNNQEIFNKVAVHLFTQGKPALGGNKYYSNGCAYLSPKGAKCAIGCLIPVKKYKPDMESNDARALLYMFPTVKRYTGNDIEFLVGLQQCHDTFDNWETTRAMKSALGSLARSNNLDKSILTGLRFNTKRADRIVV